MRLYGTHSANLHRHVHVDGIDFTVVETGENHFEPLFLGYPLPQKESQRDDALGALKGLRAIARKNVWTPSDYSDRAITLRKMKSRLIDVGNFSAARRIKS
jgi:hypothetical protein